MSSRAAKEAYKQPSMMTTGRRPTKIPRPVTTKPPASTRDTTRDRAIEEAMRRSGV